jgi:Ca2+-transporting ATPase
MFGFKKKTLPSTIFIENTDVLPDSKQAVASVWQQRHAPSNIGIMLAKSVNVPNDTLDIALADYVRVHGLSAPAHEPYRSIRFTEQSNGISGNVWHHGADYQVTVKGAPERILDLCDLSENERESITLQLHTLSASGADIIALAEGIFPHAIKKLTDLKSSEKLIFVGFVSLQMSVSSSARQLIALAKTQSMRIYLCTGKHQTASYYIAEQLGIAHSHTDVYDARTLDITHATDISAAVSSKNVFSRCSPQHKKQILAAVQSIDSSVRIVATPQDIQKLLAK